MPGIVRREFETVSERLLFHAGRSADLTTRKESLEDTLTPAEQQQRRYSTNRLPVLEDRLNRVAALITTQSQRESYQSAGRTGASIWHEDFKLLREHDPEPDAKVFDGGDDELFNMWCQRAHRERSEIWNKVPDSRFKRFIEIFSDPELGYMLPDFSYHRGSLSFCGNPDLSIISLCGCLVYPERIPDGLIERFFGQLSAPGASNDSPLDKIEQRSNAAVIDGVKLVFESARPILPRNYRVQIISDPAQSVADRYPDAAPLQADLTGSVLYTRKKEQGPTCARLPRGSAAPLPQSEVQCFSSVYAAYRKTCHQEDGYDDELSKLARFQVRLHRLVQAVDRDWRAGISETRKDELREQTLTLRDELTDNLRACDNRYKVRAGDLIGDITGMRDSLGRENPGPVLFRLTAATAQLKERISELPQKEGYNQRDRRALLMEISVGEESIKQFRDAIVSGAEVLERETYIFGSRTLSSAQLESGVRGIAGTMGLCSDGLSLIRARPALTFARKLQQKTVELESSLYERDRDSAQERLLEMHLIGKVHAACVCFEHLNGRLIAGERVSIESLQSMLGRLTDLFAAREIFPEHENKRYQGALDPLNEKLHIIAQGLDHYRSNHLDDESRAAMYKRLKAHLKSFDFEDLVTRLP